MLRWQLETRVLWVAGEKGSGQPGRGEEPESWPRSTVLSWASPLSRGSVGIWHSASSLPRGGVMVVSVGKEVRGKLAGRTNRSLCKMMKIGKLQRRAGWIGPEMPKCLKM